MLVSVISHDFYLSWGNFSISFTPTCQEFCSPTFTVTWSAFLLLWNLSILMTSAISCVGTVCKVLCKTCDGKIPCLQSSNFHLLSSPTFLVTMHYLPFPSNRSATPTSGGLHETRPSSSIVESLWSPLWPFPPPHPPHPRFNLQGDPDESGCSYTTLVLFTPSDTFRPLVLYAGASVVARRLLHLASVSPTYTSPWTLPPDWSKYQSASLLEWWHEFLHEPSPQGNSGNW